jgi:hypothetical protein
MAIIEAHVGETVDDVPTVGEEDASSVVKKIYAQIKRQRSQKRHIKPCT